MNNVSTNCDILGLFTNKIAVDHLVNNAGIVPLCLFEHSTDVTNFAPAMVISKTYNQHCI